MNLDTELFSENGSLKTVSQGNKRVKNASLFFNFCLFRKNPE